MRKRLNNEHNCPSPDPLLTPCSLLGGSRSDVTTNCANPQLRNVQLPGNGGALYTCANSYISCIRRFAFVFACAFVRVFVFLETLAFTGENTVFWHYPPVKLRNKFRATFFTLHCSSSLSCMNKYLAIDHGVYVDEQPTCINCSVVECFQRS